MAKQAQMPGGVIATAQVESEHSPHASSSLSSRVASSAQDLTRSVFGGSPRPFEDHGLLASIGGPSKELGLPGPFFPSASSGLDGIHLRHAGGVSSTGERSTAADRFRTTRHDRALVDSEFDDFQRSFGGLDVGDSLNEPDAMLEDVWSMTGRQRPPKQSGISGFHDLDNHPARVVHSEPDDGVALRALLTEPGPLNTSEYEDLSGEFQQSDDDNYGLEEVFKGHIAFLRSILPSAPTHGDVAPENPMNLLPNLSQLDETSSLTEDDIRRQWHEVLANYMTDVWGTHLPDQSGRSDQAQTLRVPDLAAKTVERLQMILGHLAQSSTSGVRRSSLEDLAKPCDRNIATTHLRDAAVPVCQNVPRAIAGEELETLRLDARASRGRHMDAHWGRHHEPLPPSRSATTLLDRPASPQTFKEDTAPQHEDMPVFHCPWIRCHERFHNAAQLRLHTDTHALLACPHVTCVAAFRETDTWLDHLNQAHHDLLMVSRTTSA